MSPLNAIRAIRAIRGIRAIRAIRAKRAMRLAFIASAWLATAHAADTDVASLAWMSGCWASDSSEHGTEEHWMAPVANMMLGMSRTIKGGRTAEYEFMRIAVGESGKVFYVATPSGQATASFELIRSGAREVVFENKTHDFPQRIMYRRDGDRLLASIEGRINGHDKSIQFSMHRSDCR